jgi:glycosyltransferase involved in cell wall biosynthesis
VVFPSEYEGFGIPIIEAMSFGKRVLATDIPIFREIAGDSIHYFDTKDHLISQLVRLWSEEAPYDLRAAYEPRLSRFRPEKICSEFRHYLEALP